MTTGQSYYTIMQVSNLLSTLNEEYNVEGCAKVSKLTTSEFCWSTELASGGYLESV